MINARQRIQGIRAQLALLKLFLPRFGEVHCYAIGFLGFDFRIKVLLAVQKLFL